MRFWRSAERLAFLVACLPNGEMRGQKTAGWNWSGRLLRRALFLSSFLPAFVFAQVPSPKAAGSAKKVTEHRANELTLAGLRPGRDIVSRAISRYKAPMLGKAGETPFTWDDSCRVEALYVDTDAAGTIQTIRVAAHRKWGMADCDKLHPSPWRTGRGLALFDSTDRLLHLYGPPDSKSPSTREGQPLELWYYAFDWAGENVPQVMEVLCTRETDGKPGKIVEITLAAPSL